MGFIMHGLDAEDYDRNYSDRELIGRVRDYFRPAANGMLIVGIMIVLNSMSSMVQPVLASWGIDQVLENDKRSVIWVVSGGLLLANVLAWLFNFIRQ